MILGYLDGPEPMSGPAGPCEFLNNGAEEFLKPRVAWTCGWCGRCCSGMCAPAAGAVQCPRAGVHSVRQKKLTVPSSTVTFVLAVDAK